MIEWEDGVILADRCYAGTMAKHKNWHGASRKRILKKKLKAKLKKQGS